MQLTPAALFDMSQGVHISTTMGIGAEVDPATVDPRSSRFMFLPIEPSKDDAPPS